MGGDVSGYVDADTGIPIRTAEGKQMRLATSRTAVRAQCSLLTDALKFIADRMFDSGSETGSGPVKSIWCKLPPISLVESKVLLLTTVHSPYATLQALKTLQTVIDAGQAQNKKFYLRNPETGKTSVL